MSDGAKQVSGRVRRHELEEAIRGPSMRGVSRCGCNLPCAGVERWMKPWSRAGMPAYSPAAAAGSSSAVDARRSTVLTGLFISNPVEDAGKEMTTRVLVNTIARGTLAHTRTFALQHYFGHINILFLFPLS